jgi:hypothetical protein
LEFPLRFVKRDHYVGEVGEDLDGLLVGKYLVLVLDALEELLRVGRREAFLLPLLEHGLHEVVRDERPLRHFIQESPLDISLARHSMS